MTATGVGVRALDGVAVVIGPDPGGAGVLAVVTVADVDRRERELRASAAATRLPARGTSEGRQLRRWLAHSLAAEVLVDSEIAARQPSGARGDPGPELAVAGVSGALGAGSIALAVLTRSAAARSFAGRLTADVAVGPDQLERLAAGHPLPPSRVVRHRVGGVPVNGGRPVRVRAADLPARLGSALAGARAGDTLAGRDSVGREHRLTVLDEPAGPAGIAATPGGPARDGTDALAAARARAFGRWLDGRREALVHPRPGFEHPADPRQPDNTHRH